MCPLRRPNSDPRGPDKHRTETPQNARKPLPRSGAINTCVPSRACLKTPRRALYRHSCTPSAFMPGGFVFDGSILRHSGGCITRFVPACVGIINRIHKRRQNGTQGLKTPFNHDGSARPPRTRPVPALQWRPARREADPPGPLTGPPSSARGAARARSGRSWYALPAPPRRNRPAPGQSRPELISRSRPRPC